MRIHPERENDRDGVRNVNASAFETLAEARLVDSLRAHAHPSISLVAEEGSVIIGHIMFSPAVLAGHEEVMIMGLAPMAVLPEHQRNGIGSALVRAGLAACREIDAAGVIVLGHPEFYPRFGFLPAYRFGISSEYDVPQEVFMAMALRPGAFDGKEGVVRYHEAFADL